MVTWLYIFVKTHRTAHPKRLSFTVSRPVVSQSSLIKSVRVSFTLLKQPEKRNQNKQIMHVTSQCWTPRRLHLKSREKPGIIMHGETAETGQKLVMSPLTCLLPPEDFETGSRGWPYTTDCWTTHHLSDRWSASSTTKYQHTAKADNIFRSQTQRHHVWVTLSPGVRLTWKHTKADSLE